MKTTAEYNLKTLTASPLLSGAGLALCVVKNCRRAHKARGYCDRHYQQVRLYGRVLSVTKFDRRPAIVEADIARIPLGVNGRQGYTIVDRSDIWVERYNWHKDAHGYVASRINGRLIKLHQLLICPPPGWEVDHSDNDPLNNRRSNLRVSTHVENGRNLACTGRSNSGFKGVYFNARRGKFEASIYHGRSIHLGRFSTAEAAAEAYDAKARELFGEYAKLNFGVSA